MAMASSLRPQSSAFTHGNKRCKRVRGNATFMRAAPVMEGTSRFIVGGNWKCNGTSESINTLVSNLNKSSVDSRTEVVCFPPFPYIPSVQSSVRNDFAVGAQNAHAGTGAYTGEVAAEMLADMGIKWTITGHSERRLIFGEQDETVAQKTAYALSCGLSVVACIGETLEQRDDNRTFEVVSQQLAALTKEVPDLSNVVIAYEPVWAIGTGRTATPEQAQEVHGYIRNWLSKNVGQKTSESMRIQYGGSVKSGNCKELASQEDIDGFLVGGASLDPNEFTAIINSVDASEH